MSNVYYPSGKPAPCHWCHKDCGGTCLGVNEPGGPRQMKTDDPAYWMLKDGHVSTKEVHRDDCYICRDPEYAQMGLSLCKPCPQCSETELKGGAPMTQGHVPADDEECSDCGYNLREHYEREAKEETA